MVFLIPEAASLEVVPVLILEVVLVKCRLNPVAARSYLEVVSTFLKVVIFVTAV